MFPLRPHPYTFILSGFAQSIIGTLILRREWEHWAGRGGKRGQPMEKSGSSHQRRWWGKEGKKQRGKERVWRIWHSSQLFSSRQTAAHLEYMNKLENLTRNKRGMGEGERGSGERVGPSGDSLSCYSAPSRCLIYVSFCGRGTGLPPCSSLFLLPSLSFCSFRTSSESSHRALGFSFFPFLSLFLPFSNPPPSPRLTFLLRFNGTNLSKSFLSVYNCPPRKCGSSASWEPSESLVLGGLGGNMAWVVTGCLHCEHVYLI